MDNEFTTSDYKFEGPGSTQDGHQFVVCATLDAGAIECFSGIHLIIYCNDESEDFNGLDITHSVGQWYDFRALQGEKSTAVNPFQDIIDAQAAGREHTNTVLKGPAQSGPPLYKVFYEIFDTSNATNHCANIELRPSLPKDMKCRVVYEYVVTGRESLVVYLSSSRSFRPQLKPNNPSRIVCAYPASMGICGRGVRILPPQISRKSSAVELLPPELLSLIFGCAVEESMYTHWRQMLISFALVCHKWSIALGHLFRDFGTYTSGGPEAEKVALSLQRNPVLGESIRVFSNSHFGEAKHRAPETEQTYLEFSRAIVDILKHATLLRDLEIRDTHPTLMAEFIHAITRSQELRGLLVNRGPLSEDGAQDQYRAILSTRDIIHCLAQWPRLVKLRVFGFSGPNPFLLPGSVDVISDEDLQAGANVTSPLKELLLYNGPITGPQLQLITSGAHRTLQDVSLKGIIGLTNQGLRAWLAEVGPSLTRFHLEQTSVGRQSDDEEYALDAVISQMTNLRDLRIDGDVASELVILRREPRTQSQTTRYHMFWDSIHCEDVPGLNPHGLVNALKYTGWRNVNTRGIFNGNEALKEEAVKAAKDRGVTLWDR